MNAELMYFERNGNYFGKSQGWQSVGTDMDSVVKEVRDLRRSLKLPGIPDVDDIFVIVTVEGENPRHIT